MADTAPKVAATEHHDPIETVNKKAELLAQYIQKSKHFIVFTGAGISTSAGQSSVVILPFQSLIAHENQRHPGLSRP